MNAKDLFIQNYVAPLKDMTEHNAHSEAVSFLADMLGNIRKYDARTMSSHDLTTYIDKLILWAKYIEEQHNDLGYLPYALSVFRKEVLDGILAELSEFLTKEQMSMINSAL